VRLGREVRVVEFYRQSVGIPGGGAVRNAQRLRGAARTGGIAAARRCVREGFHELFFWSFHRKISGIVSASQSLTDPHSLSEHFRRGGHESNFLAIGGRESEFLAIMPLNIPKALQLGQLINVAYTSGTAIPPNYAIPAGSDYKLMDVINGNDLATEIGGAKLNVPFGFIAKNVENDLVVVIRGTLGIWEWIQDARFLRVPCPLAPGAGETEDGFTSVYQSLTVGATASSLFAYLKSVNPLANSITITGHSLGSALATLLAYDLAVNSVYTNPSVVTFASPQVGDLQFVDTYNNEVPDTYRIANVPDIVPGLPGPLLGYDHIDQLVRVNSIGKAKAVPTCTHSLDTYLYLLDLMHGGNTFQLSDGCQGWLF